MGKYVVAASYGSNRAEKSFVLTPPSKPGIRVLGPGIDFEDPNPVSPDSTAEVFATGLKGVPKLRLNLYIGSSNARTVTYFSSATVNIPPTGNTVIELPTGKPQDGKSFVLTARVGAKTLIAGFYVLAFREPNYVVGPLPTR